MSPANPEIICKLDALSISLLETCVEVCDTNIHICFYMKYLRNYTILWMWDRNSWQLLRPPYSAQDVPFPEGRRAHAQQPMIYCSTGSGWNLLSNEKLRKQHYRWACLEARATVGT